jgi:ankyrin repeat protein
MSAGDRPSSFSLEHLKKQAKHRLRGCRAGDRAAIAAVQAVLPGLRALDAAALAERIQLADVQQAVAIERGFSSWADLTRHGDPLLRLLAAVRGGHARALRRDVQDFSGLAAVNIYAACALGDSAAVAKHLERDPPLATAPHDGWPPLMYVSGSPLARFSARHATSLVACAELLLDAGADPNIATKDEDADTPSGTSAVMRALLSGNVLLVWLFKKRGVLEPVEAMRQWLADHASPDAATLQQTFGEYFRRPDVREAMRAEMAARANQPGALTPALASDPLELQQLRMPNLIGAKEDLWGAMLDRGYDPTVIQAGGRSALHGVVTYAPPTLLELFLSRGVDLNVRDADGRSVLATAVRAGNLAAADLLRARGIVDDTTPMDWLLGRCLAGDAEGARQVVAEHPGLTSALTRGDAEVLVRAAGRGNVDQVRLLTNTGIDPDVHGDSGATALHQAAWRGQVAVARLLLDRGASRDVRDDLYGQTPREWALHGSIHAQGARDRCLEVVEMLLA